MNVGDGQIACAWPVVGDDPLSPAAVERQRRFLKVAVAKLLGVEGAEEV